jgi:hypothetical protein
MSTYLDVARGDSSSVIKLGEASKAEKLQRVPERPKSQRGQQSLPSSHPN